MRPALRPRARRPLRDQVLVVTGASSGIGLTTAQYGAIAGARVVMVSRNEAILRERSEELNRDGATTIAIGADVTSLEQMCEVAAKAIQAYGRIDTWINNAGVSLFGPLGEVPVLDARRVFDVNYFGVVNGTLAALPHLRESGGTLINIGGNVTPADTAPQGHYAASKAAVRSFSQAIREELEAEQASVSVVLIEPSSMDTPFRLHARSYLGFSPPFASPVYVPEVAAGVILQCAVQPRREVRVGAGAVALGRLWSRTAAPANETAPAASSMTNARKPGNLIEWSVPAGSVRGGYSGHVRVNSALTTLSLRINPSIVSMATVAMAAVSFALLFLRAY